MPAPDGGRTSQWRVADRQSAINHLLFVAYVLSFAAVVLTDFIDVPEQIFLWLVLPPFVAALVSPLRPARSPMHYPIGRLFTSIILWAALIYIVATIVSTILSKDAAPPTGRPLKLYLRWGAELAVYLAVTAYLTLVYPYFIKRFLLAVLVLLAINAIINVVLYLHTPVTTLTAFRLSANFGTPQYQNATHMAPLFAIYAMGGLGLLATQPLARWQIWIVTICTSVLLCAIIATQARGAYGAVLIALIFIAIAAPPQRRLWIAGLAMLGIGMAVALPPVREALLMRGFSFRTELVAGFLEFAWIHPWLGYGFDGVFQVRIDDILFDQPHNTLVWAQLRGGIIATLAAAAMLAGSLFYAFRIWQKTRNVSYLIIVLVMAVVSLTEIGFLLYPFNWIWITFWLPIGIGAGAELIVKQTAAKPTDADRP